MYPIHDAELIGQMRRKLSDLAAEWRTDKQDTTVRQYQALLRALVALGFRDELPVDSELPAALMPEEYTSMWTGETATP